MAIAPGHLKLGQLVMTLLVAIASGSATPVRADARQRTREERIRSSIAVFAQPTNIGASHIWFMPSDRHLAASTLLVRIGKPAVNALIDELRAETPERRYLAAWTLGKIRDRRATPALVAALETDEVWGVSARAADALAAIRDSAAIEPLLRTIRANPEGPPYYAIYALEAFPTPETITTLVGLLGLSSPRYSQRRDLGRDAGLTLGRMGRPALPQLLVAVNDPRPAVRLNAGFGLMQMKGKRAMNAVIGLLADPSPQAREEIAFALGHKKERWAVEALITALTDPVPGVRVEAARALGKIGDQRAAGPLIEALRGSDEQLAPRAAEALGELGAREAVEPLLNVLDAPIWDRMRSAATALGMLQDRRAAVPLDDLLSKVPTSPARAEAIASLGRLGYRPAMGKIAGALMDREEPIRSVAAEALGRLGDRTVAPLLITALTDAESVRTKAAVALGRLRIEAAVEPLRQMMVRDYRNYHIYSAARDAIHRITGKQPPRPKVTTD